MNLLNKKTISEQIVNCIDLTDANLEEISTLESGRVQGGWGNWGSCGSCGSCEWGSCFSLNVSSGAFAGSLFGSCSCESCSCGSCSCGSCEGF